MKFYAVGEQGRSNEAEKKETAATKRGSMRVRALGDRDGGDGGGKEEEEECSLADALGGTERRERCIEAAREDRTDFHPPPISSLAMLRAAVSTV
jgi:hypothetical protein